MSQIFDALLKSEIERAGRGQTGQTDATGLLRHVELQAVPNWNVTPMEAEEASIGVALEAPLEGELAHGRYKSIEGYEIARSVDAESASVLNQFQSHSIAISPNSRLVSLTDDDGAPAEAFRLLSVRLRDIRKVRPLRKILITSSNPQEGKSTTAANLACALARNSKDKILLIEGDLRKPTLEQIFGLEGLPGICEWLQGTNDLSANIYHLEEANLWISPAGRYSSNPLELLQSAKLPFLMEQLGLMFDWIIVDSPPVLPLADTSVWTRMVDGILLVTRRGITEKKQLTSTLQALEQEKLIGSLLNCSTSSVYRRYYYKSTSVA